MLNLKKFYEIHITTETNDIEQFKRDCFTTGMKPIIIQTEARDGQKELQVMTSSKYSDGKHFVRLKLLSEQLVAHGYKILRQKIEVVPFGGKKRKGHLYYESHFRLQLNNDLEKVIAVTLCKQYEFHLSKNILKKELGFDFQMCTYRGHEDEKTFRNKIESFRAALFHHKIKFDKAEIEECIYDSNISIDAAWLEYA